MSGKPSFRGAPAPLFDRIKVPAQGSGGSARSLSLLDKDEVVASVIKEIALMLNSRCTIRRRLYEDHIDDVLVYGMPDMLGLPDFTYFDAANEQDWSLASKLLEITISSIEPRIRNVKAKIQNFDPKTQDLIAEISGTVKSGPLTQDIRFPLTLSQNDYQGATSQVA